MYGKIKIYGKNGGADLSVYQKNFNGEDVNILAMHGQVVTHAGVIKEDEISLPLLRNKGIDYLALGHVHKAVEGRLDGRGVYAYSGCPEGRGFDETGDKGFIELTVNGKNVSYKFIPFAKRKIYEIEVPCDSFENWFECRDFAINKVQNDVEISGLVKLVFVGKRNGFEIDKIGVEKLLQDACLKVQNDW